MAVVLGTTLSVELNLLPRPQIPQLAATRGAPARAGSAASTSHPSALVLRAADALRTALPEYDIKIIDPVTLRIDEDGTPQFRIGLFRVAQVCKAAPSRCDYTLGSFLARVIQVVREKKTRFRRSMLRAVARSTRYVHDLQSQAQNGPDGAIVARPFAGDISIVCEFDLPSSTVPAFAGHLRKIGLDPARAIALCRKNMRANLPPLAPQLHRLSAHDLGILQGDGYTSSQFLFPKRWRAFAAMYPRGIIAAVPSDDTILYVRDDDSVAVGTLLAMAKHVEATSVRPVSHMVFRLTRIGWVPVAQ